MSPFKPGTERFSATPNGPEQTSSVNGFRPSTCDEAGGSPEADGSNVGDVGKGDSRFSTMNPVSGVLNQVRFNDIYAKPYSTESKFFAFDVILEYENNRIPRLIGRGKLVDGSKYAF
ncbi:hypothetical protein [Prosthecobacter sp.]|uniref:hypothetical protein n=1 Tax=Prosthecobacter sp. TaxID=1965333 RepID=UPI0024892977|nr:hypothetical protein [Prosthecobacter sp.]MDI1312600.1 hypothetical protein [Prosthecobacter sp.]